MYFSRVAKWSKHRLEGASKGHVRLTPEDGELDRFIVLLKKKLLRDFISVRVETTNLAQITRENILLLNFPLRWKNERAS